MSRPCNIIPTSSLNVHLPVDVRAKLDLHLFSEVEGRVPMGAYQRFLVELVKNYFEGKALDLSPYLNELPGVHIIRGSEMTIALIKASFEARRPSGD